MQYGEGIMSVGEFCGHAGLQPGVTSAMWYLPQEDATVIVSANREDPYDDPTPADALAAAVVKIVFPKYLER